MSLFSVATPALNEIRLEDPESWRNGRSCAASRSRATSWCSYLQRQCLLASSSRCASASPTFIAGVANQMGLCARQCTWPAGEGVRGRLGYHFAICEANDVCLGLQRCAAAPSKLRRQDCLKDKTLQLRSFASRRRECLLPGRGQSTELWAALRRLGCGQVASARPATTQLSQAALDVVTLSFSLHLMHCLLRSS
jgi:hypothetical protein